MIDLVIDSRTTGSMMCSFELVGVSSIALRIVDKIRSASYMICDVWRIVVERRLDEWWFGELRAGLNLKGSIVD